MYQIYNRAIQNEIYVDKLAFIETNLVSIINYTVIRPYVTQKFIKKHPILFKFIFWVVSKTWLFWNSLLQTILFFKFIIKKIFARTKKIDQEDKLVFAATPRLFDQIKKIKNQSEVPNKTLVIGKAVNKRDASLSFEVTEVCSYRDIFKAYIFSLIAPVKLRDLLIDNENLQTYNSFEWFLINCFLTRQKGIKEIWFANHFDRWAILFDNLKIERKIIVQHGIENGKLIPPVMLKSITKAYLIKADQKPFFVGKIIENDFEFEELKSEIKLTEIFCQDKLRVLIVGNASIHSVEERFLIQHLSSLNIHFCLKPHPVLSQNFYTELKQDTDFLLIADKNTFPVVDVVISYESTLGLEYELEGVKVLYYADNTVDEIIQYLKRSIKE